MSWAPKRYVAQLAQNVNALAFIVGFAALYVGVSGFSRPAANIVAGVLIMVIAVRPYLHLRPR